MVFAQCSDCRRLPATDRRLEVVCSVLLIGAVDSFPRRGVVFSFSDAPSQVHWQGEFGDEVDGMKGDTMKLLNDDDDRPKRSALWNSRKTRVARCVCC